jgi:hypothetical protein
MSDFLVSEDIADNWILLDLDVLRKEVESKGGKWNVDGYCKGFINNPNIKLPSPEEIELRLIEIWTRDMARKPFVILLTHSLKELAEVAPDACAYIRMSKWRGPK